MIFHQIRHNYQSAPYGQPSNNIPLLPTPKFRNYLLKRFSKTFATFKKESPLLFRHLEQHITFTERVQCKHERRTTYNGVNVRSERHAPNFVNG